VPPSSRSRENWILTVGRLIDTKHHDRLIRLFLKARADGWKLVIVGADAQRQNNLNRLKELVSRAGAEERVVLAGGQKDVDTFYRQSKIFAFTSSSEGFPNAVGEALSAGLPVVSYDCIAGPSEMVRDGENGFLVPVFDDSAFLGRLQRLIDDDGLREAMAHRAPTSVAAYSLECIGERFLRMMLG
jgi:glycosyltransferase involved in cell wall biosynthesis